MRARHDDDLWTRRHLPQDACREPFHQRRYLWNSFFISTVITVAALFFPSMAAYALARLRFPGREKLFGAIFATLLVTAPVVLIPLFLVARQLGLLDSYAGLIIPAIFNAFGIFLLPQFYLGLPKELEEAAVIDGCGHWRVYWNIVLPMSRDVGVEVSAVR
ncbi:carbohydrate ABC transporter permease [Streptomyces sp. DSM 41524]|uniref:Carbohydrate ABC transporter permease n=1 Tax=Streptomyces asiaticus subsp. ignotus TaxID=3098222 RepID=A0ABU7Q3T3_9ACTN|nr:carbohydrate ABC transporter permease [Streptomyces sp. DSM 41524]